MIAAEKKQLLLRDIFTYPNGPENQILATNKLQKLLLQDTNGGKLYKFRSFDENGYALDNLRTGTLYCANPTAFNDPFDCKIGITLQSAYSAFFEKEFDEVENVLNLLCGVIYNKVHICEVPEDKQRILNRLLSCNDLVAFIANCHHFSKPEIIQSFFENKAIMANFLQLLLQNEHFSKVPSMGGKLIPGIIEQLTPEGRMQISQGDASCEDFLRATGVPNGDDDEIGLFLQASAKISPELAADRSAAEQVIGGLKEKITDQLASLFFVGCLCTDFKNRLMWSHYADGHKGFCIEYDFSQSKELLPLPVYYTENRPLVPWKAAINNTYENMAAATAELAITLLTKDSAWSYENEWRILVKASDEHNITMPPITCIYLGAAICEYDRNCILEIAKKLRIPVKQMKIDRGAYALHTQFIYNPQDEETMLSSDAKGGTYE